MKRKSVTLIGSTFALLLTVASAHANPVPPDTISITENWEPSGPGFTATTVGGVSGFAAAAPGHPSDFLFLSDEASQSIDVPTQFSTLPPSRILATNLQIVSTLGKGQHADYWTNFSLSVVLTNNATHDSTSPPLVFSGKLHIVFYQSLANVSVFDSNGHPITGPVSQNVTLDGAQFTVTLDRFTSPTRPGSVNHGSIGGEIVATVSGGGTQNTPEPSTLLLSCLGLSGLGAASWRKWRARKAA